MNIRSLLITASLALSALTTTHAAVETYVADPAHSSVAFSIRHIFSEVPGHFTKFSATLNVDRDNLENSSADATVWISSVDTSNSDRNAHLQKAEFFDAAKYPTMTFKSTSWKKTGDETYDVTGNLTIKGVTKPVVLKVQSLGFGEGLQPGVMVSGWKATTTINRRDFGVDGPAMLGKAVGDDVAITISTEADLKK